jgi:hypothetical protein
MSVRFTIRYKDVERLERALQNHRCLDEQKQWIVYLSVAPAVAEFQFGSKMEQYPIDGKAPGFAKFPRDLIHRIFSEPDRQAFPKEVPVEISEGRLRIDGFGINGDIEVGYFREPVKYGGIVYLGDAELAALQAVLPDIPATAGILKPHIDEAAQRIAERISFASHSLKPCGFTYEEVAELVGSRIATLAPEVKARVDALERFHGKAQTSHP